LLGEIAGDLDGEWAAFKQLILPACTMALFVIAPLARITRASDAASLGSDFVRTARSVGLSWWRIVVTYALRNAILPVITIAGIVFSTMLGANVLVEKVFLLAWRRLLRPRRAAVVGLRAGAGFVLLMAFVFVIVNLVVDVLSASPNPRVSSDEQRDLAACRFHPARQSRHRHRRSGCALLSRRRSSAPGMCPNDRSFPMWRTRCCASAAHSPHRPARRDVFSRIVVAARPISPSRSPRSASRLRWGR